MLLTTGMETILGLSTSSSQKLYSWFGSNITGSGRAGLTCCGGLAEFEPAVPELMLAFLTMFGRLRWVYVIDGESFGADFGTCLKRSGVSEEAVSEVVLEADPADAGGLSREGSAIPNSAGGVGTGV